MLILSHNTWTYLPPVSRWMWLVAPFSVCQCRDTQEQVENGVEGFDLRLKMWRGAMNMAHGLYVMDSYTYLSSLLQAGPLYCRVLLESRHPTAEEVKAFVQCCDRLERMFPNIIFFGGHGAHKPNWHRCYYHFKSEVAKPTFLEYHASVCGGLFPYLWRRRHKDLPNTNVMTDFC